MPPYEAGVLELLELLEYDLIFSLKGHGTLNFKKILTAMKHHDDS